MRVNVELHCFILFFPSKQFSSCVDVTGREASFFSVGDLFCYRKRRRLLKPRITTGPQEQASFNAGLTVRGKKVKGGEHKFLILT